MGKDLKCSYCDRRFSVYRSLRRHENVHTGNLHHCDQCNKGFTDPWILRRHLLIHGRKMPVKVDPKKFPCKQCGIVFLVKKNLESHLCEVGRQAPPKVKYQCSECRVTYTMPSAIRDHKCSKPSPTILPQISGPEIEIPLEYILSENVTGGHSEPAYRLGDDWPNCPPDDMFSHQITRDDHHEETFSSSSEYVYRCSTPETNLWTPYAPEVLEVPEVFPHENCSRLDEDKRSPKWVPGVLISPEGGWKTPIGCGTSVSQTQFIDQTAEYDENKTMEYNERSEDHFVPECVNGPNNGYWSRKDCSSDCEKSSSNVYFMSHKNNLEYSQTSFSNETVKSSAFTGSSAMLPSFSRGNNSKCPPSVCYPGVIVSRKSFEKN